jgi:hypothetical protein
MPGRKGESSQSTDGSTIFQQGFSMTLNAAFLHSIKLKTHTIPWKRETARESDEKSIRGDGLHWRLDHSKCVNVTMPDDMTLSILVRKK